MLRQPQDKRTLNHNLMLASSSAFVAGFIDVVGLLAFLAFTSNVTGHVANLAKNILQQDFSDVIIFGIWLLMFMMGSFTSKFIIQSLKHKSWYRAHSAPIIIEIFVLLFVAVYGNKFYHETDTERKIVIGALLFAMGLQNGLVSNISGGLIKSTHLTGLFTDLGSELAEWMHPRTEDTQAVKNKVYVRITVLTFFIAGGLAGGYFFNIYEFKVFYFVPLILLTILYYDLLPVFFHKIYQLIYPTKTKITKS
ncbi:YoaK family protein [Mucilaginibacter lutimaris]|uniref:YoaK family protein n=1 Tax=Mucilaginibacter lutimaris TaxID=931629 RepID=A0ABW2ZCW3_9SPHI